MKVTAKRCLGLVVLGLLGAGGCASPRPQNWSPEEHSSPIYQLTVEAGDEIELRFFDTPELNFAQVVRPDGKVSLDLIGDVKVAGYTPAQVRKALMAEYEKQLQTKEVTVVVRSHASIYVSGAVNTPGTQPLMRPTTALQAIMEAGGFVALDADTRNVVVIRQVDGRSKSFVVNCKKALESTLSDPFYLLPNDIINVPQTTTYF